MPRVHHRPFYFSISRPIPLQNLPSFITSLPPFLRHFFFSRTGDGWDRARLLQICPSLLPRNALRPQLRCLYHRPDQTLAHRQVLKRCCQSPKNMDNKEYLFTVEEDLDISSFSRLRTAQKNSKKSGRCNLRKSVAWNSAFFTEEGVLDPIELSVLSGSSMKMKESALSMANGHMPPSLGVHKSGTATPSNSVGPTSLGKIHSQSGSKSLKEGNLGCRLDASNREERQEIMASGTISSGKNTTKGVHRLAATLSIASTNAVNPPSKIPKFMPRKSSVSSLPVTPGDAIRALENKFEKTNSTVNTGLVQDTKFVPSNMRKPLYSAQSLKLSATDLSRPFVQLDKCTSTRSTCGSSASKVGQGTTIPCSSFKGTSSLGKNANHDAGDVASMHAKPSALRMPSPSLGFFQQGRLPSYATQQPTIRLAKATNVKQADELSSVDSSNGNVVQPPKNVSTLHRDMNIRISGGSDSQISAQQASKRNHLEVDINIDNLPQVLSSKMPEPNMDKKVPFISNSMLQLDKKPVHGIYATKEFMKVNVSEDACHPSSPTRKKSSSGSNSSENSSQTCFMGKQNQTFDGASGVDSQVKQSSPDNTVLVNNAVSEQDGGPAGNLSPPGEGVSGLSDRLFDSSPLPKNKSSLSLNYVKEVCSVFANRSIAGCSLAEATVTKDDDSRNNDWTSVFSEAIKPSLRSNTDQISGFCSISDSETDDSRSQRTGVPAEKAHSSANKLAVRLINNSSEDSQPTQSADCNVHDSTMQLGKKDVTNSKEDSTMLNGSKNEQKDKWKQDIGLLKHQLNATPFSEEWLAAIETFGEEILQLKTGRVQNSPPVKTLPEPSPWSPVKRKAQDIGPFDCTKHSINQSTIDTS